MCGCDKHNNRRATCTCICPAHKNFQAAYDLARARYDVILGLQENLDLLRKDNAVLSGQVARVQALAHGSQVFSESILQALAIPAESTEGAAS